jgi:PST family polysaccharide transporter
MIRSDQFETLASAARVSSGLRTKSVRGALFTAAGGGADLAVRLLSTLILARLLLPEHFGLLGMVTAFTAIAEQLSSLGLSTATIQAPKITHRQCSNLFWTNVATGLVLAGLICGAAPFIALFYQDPRLVMVSVAIATNFFWGGLAVQHEALLNRQMRQPEVAVNRIVASSLSTLLAIALAIYGFGYWALVWREVTRSLLLVGCIWRLLPWIPSLPCRGVGTGALFRFGRDLTMAQIFVVIVMRLDSVLIGRTSGAIPLGMYRQAQSLLGPIEMLNGPIQNVAQPGLSALQSEPARYRRYYERVLSLIGLLTIPFGAFCALYAEEIVQIVLGPKWAGTAVFLQIVAIGAAVRPSIATSGVVLVTMGKHGVFLALAIVHSITLVLLMFLGIPWGAVGIATAHVVASVLLAVPKLYYSFAGTPITLACFFRCLAQPLVATMIMCASLTAVRQLVLPNAVYSLSLGSVSAAIVFLLSYVALPGGAGQLRLLMSDVRTSVSRHNLEERAEPA